MIINGTIKIEEELGRGSFATVYKATIVGKYPPLDIGDVVAVKSISTNKFSSEEERKKLENEISVMQTLQHENIVKLYGVQRTKKSYYLIMEYCESGDLHDFLRKFPQGIDQTLIYSFALQIGKGLEYLQSKEIVHRDLKPHNIMLCGKSPNLTLKIADFGLARILHQDQMAATICGSPLYMAPEILFNTNYTAAVDMWSLGVILFELAPTKTPFPDCKTMDDLKKQIVKHGSHPIQIPNYIKVSNQYKDLVSSLLLIDPNKRLNIQQYFNHPFFKEKPQVIDENKKEIELNSHRKQKFSFMDIIKLTNSQSPDQVLQLLKEVANTVEQLFTECHELGNSVLFDLLKTLCEFLMDMLKECKYQGSCELEDDILELIKEYRNNAVELSKEKMEDPKISALQFLFNKGIEFVKSGFEAEKENDLSYAQYEYTRAMNVLCPVIFLKDTQEELTSVQILYDQLMAKITKPLPDDSLQF